MSQTTRISKQWVTCPGCNKTVLRSTSDIQPQRTSWFRPAWTLCSPACESKAWKRHRWSLLCPAMTAVLLTGSTALNVYTTLRCPGAALGGMQWMTLGLLPLLWGGLVFVGWWTTRAITASTVVERSHALPAEMGEQEGGAERQEPVSASASQ